MAFCNTGLALYVTAINEIVIFTIQTVTFQLFVWDGLLLKCNKEAHKVINFEKFQKKM